MFEWQFTSQSYSLLQNLWRSGGTLCSLCQTTHSTKIIQRTSTMWRNTRLLSAFAKHWVRFWEIWIKRSSFWPILIVVPSLRVRHLFAILPSYNCTIDNDERKKSKIFFYSHMFSPGEINTIKITFLTEIYIWKLLKVHHLEITRNTAQIFQRYYLGSFLSVARLDPCGLIYF